MASNLGCWAKGPHRGNEPAKFIIVDANDAGDRLEIGCHQQILWVPGQEDAIHHTGDHLKGLRGTLGQATLSWLMHSPSHPSQEAAHLAV